MTRTGSGAAVAVSLALVLSGCADWQGVNSLPLPGTETRYIGRSPGTGRNDVTLTD